MRTFPFFRWLCRQPVKRIPAVSLRWNNKKTQNMPSFMMQACGDVLPRKQACERCAEMKGPYNECVVINDAEFGKYTGGSCANCWYGKLGSSCTLRTGVTNSSAHLTSPPPPASTATAANPPLHPSFAAAVQGTETPVLHPRFATILERNNPTTQAPPSQGQPPALSPALSSLATSVAITTNLVQLWENRYRNMTPEKLIEAYEQLQEMQQDLNTRTQAIHRVILGGLKDAMNVSKRNESSSTGES